MAESTTPDGERGGAGSRLEAGLDSGWWRRLRDSLVSLRATAISTGPPPNESRSQGWARAVSIGLTGGLLAVFLVEVATAERGGLFGAGVDLDIYTIATRNWLADGTWYLPRQLGGPYDIQFGDILYPPTLLWLTVPFTVLPRVLWWIVPGMAAAIGLWRLRPAPWAWPILAASLAWPRTVSQVIFGNPVIWVAAAVFSGIGSAALLKPTVIPFAVVGMRSRRWWVALGVLLVLTIPVLPLALQYPGVLLNGRSDAGWLYSVGEWPLLLIPSVAWIARRPPPRA